MRIPCIAALAALIVTASAVQAQRPEVAPRARFAVSAFTGVRAPFTTGATNFFDEQGEFLFTTREQRGGSPVLGLEGEVRVRGPVSAVAGATYSQGGMGEFFVDRRPGFAQASDFSIRYLSPSWFVKAGASVHFQEGRRVEDDRRPTTTDLTVAAAMVRQLGTNHPALNLGFEGSIPVGGSGVGVTLGLEDYLVFWNDDDLRTATLGTLRAAGTDAADADLLFSTSNILVIRLGAALRF